MMNAKGSTPRIYTPESPIRRPRQLFGDMAADLRGAWMLARRLLIRDLSALYRQTAFGYVWAVIPPLATTLVWLLLNASQFVSINTGDIPYPVFVITGTIFWFLFFDALNAPLKQLSGNKSMLNRVNFPTEALLLSGIGQVLFSFAIKLVILSVALLAFQVPVRWTAVFLALPVFGLLAIGTVVGVLLAPIGLLYKDVEQALLVLVTPLMFLTPVVYPPPSAGAIATIMSLNPLTPMFEVVRELLYGGDGAPLGAFALVLASTLVMASLGWLVYRLALPVLIERMDA